MGRRNRRKIELSQLKFLSYAAFLIAFLITFAILAKVILVPLAFAAIIAVQMSPVSSYLERKGLNRFWSIFLSIIGLVTVVSSLLVGISMMFTNVYENLPLLKSDLKNGVDVLLNKVSNFTNIPKETLSGYTEVDGGSWAGSAFNLIEVILSNSIGTLTSVSLALLFCFFFLLYRSGIKYILLYKRSAKEKGKWKEMIKKLKNMIQGYINGLFIISVLIGTLNSLSLWIIGIDYPFFWGYLGGLLIIIPYIGTLVGGLLPFLYALATTSTFWQPVSIIIFYALIQQLEGNFITPKIIGDKINVNPFAVIIAMLSGGLIWGIAGVILAIPIVGVLKILLLKYKSTYKIAYLLSGDLYDLEHVIPEKERHQGTDLSASEG